MVAKPVLTDANAAAVAGVAGQQGLSAPEAWVDLYGDYLYRIALVRLGNATVAEDLVQETLLAALQARKTYKGAGSEKSWLAGILRNKIMDHIRQTSREQTGLLEALPEQEVLKCFGRAGHWQSTSPAAPANWSGHPARDLSQKEFMLVLQQCLARLPRPAAHAFVLREMEGVAARDIQSQLGITESNFYVLMHRARLRLRECLQVNWFRGPKHPRRNKPTQ